MASHAVSLMSYKHGTSSMKNTFWMGVQAKAMYEMLGFPQLEKETGVFCS